MSITVDAARKLSEFKMKEVKPKVDQKNLKFGSLSDLRTTYEPKKKRENIFY